METFCLLDPLLLELFVLVPSGCLYFVDDVVLVVEFGM